MDFRFSRVEICLPKVIHSRLYPEIGSILMETRESCIMWQIKRSRVGQKTASRLSSRSVYTGRTLQSDLHPGWLDLHMDIWSWCLCTFNRNDSSEHHFPKIEVEIRRLKTVVPPVLSANVALSACSRLVHNVALCLLMSFFLQYENSLGV